MEKRISGSVAVRRARTRDRAIRRPASTKKRIKTFLAFATLAVLSAIAIAATYLIMIFVQVSRTLPSVTEIGTFKPTEGTKIFYADGPLMAVISTENRKPVDLAEIDKKLIAATIATEDSRFYEHKGVDYHSVARAVFRNVTGGNLKAEGASTITQQLARNINELGLSRRKKLDRKIAEAIQAVRIEQSFSKEEILKLYLNQIYYGAGAHGIEAAARTYFHKSAKSLTLSQAAFLAGLPQSPTAYSQPGNRDSALRRRDIVLQRMVDTHRITLAEKEAARAERLKIYKPDFNGTRILGSPYFVNYVMSQLLTDSKTDRGYGPDFVFSGLSIYTTLDSRMQICAEKTLRDGIENSNRSANQGCLICIDPRTGHIRAMVGGLDYKKDQFNVAVQGKRQPGSAFKPIVYTAAIDTDTADLDKSYVDDPYYPGWKENPEHWLPKNYKGKYSNHGMSVKSAITWSVNTVAVKAAIDTGIGTVIEYAHKMGISTTIQPYAPIALGAAAVHPIELCSAYTVFANGGRRALPMGITRVVAANGDILDERSPEVQSTGIRPETIEQMNVALQEVVQRGTGTRAAPVPNAHGKTGTTSDNRDAWFAGYTPELATVIWVGREERNKKGKVVRYLEMPGATGGEVCAPMWRDFMLKAVPLQQEVDRAAHAGAVVAAPAATLTPEEAAKKAKADAKKAAEANARPKLGPPEAGGPRQNTEVQQPVNPDAPLGDQAIAPPTTSAPPSLGAPGPALAPSSSQPLTQPGFVAPIASVSVNVRPSPTHVDSSAAPRMSEPTGRVAAPPPPRRPDPGDDLITVRLCADSLRQATRWCDSTIERKMRRRDAPGRCKTHRAPPGEDG